MAEIKNFRDIIAWQKAHQFVLVIYKVTAKFPNEEKYGLISQIRRAAVSVGANIVEGFHRNYIGDGIKFYRYSESSLEEVKCHLLVSRDLVYIDNSLYYKTLEQADEVGKVLNGWMISQMELKKDK